MTWAATAATGVRCRGSLDWRRRPLRDQQSPQQIKCYPLHKLMAQCEGSGLSGARYDKTIGKIGDRLIASLKEAETAKTPEDKTIAINDAFDTAMHDLAAVTDRLINTVQIDNLICYKLMLRSQGV